MMLTSIPDAALEDLSKNAVLVAENSYSPYSRFKVGAALLLDDGKVVTGTNVESTSFGLTICAERAALVRAISEFGPDIRVRAIAVANLNGAPSPPCGGCRQMLTEFATPDALVIFPVAGGKRTMRLEELLPLGFYLESK